MISGVKKYNNFRYSSIEWLLTALVIDNEEAFSQKKKLSMVWLHYLASVQHMMNMLEWNIIREAILDFVTYFNYFVRLSPNHF